MKPLTDEEIERLRALLPFAEEIREQSRYRQATRLIWEKWRKFIIALAGFIAAVVALYELAELAVGRVISG